MRKAVALLGAMLVFSALPVFAQQLPAICSVDPFLTQGDNGATISTLQSFLASQGYFNTTPTGYFGPITEAALVAFQNATGITTAAGGDGLFGDFTHDYILQHFCAAASNGSQSGELSANPTSGQASLVVTFSGIGSSISFGDGTSQTGIGGAALGTVTHTYTSVGTYTATSGNLSATINVSGNASTPVGSLSSYTTSGPAPLAVTFYVSCADAASYDIVFGDGTDLGSASGAAPECNGGLQSVAHTYTNPGSYTATLDLFVQSGDGTFTTTEQGSIPVTVTGTSETTTTTTTNNATSSASLVATPDSGSPPLTVTFTGSAPGESYTLNFGDGSSTMAVEQIDCADGDPDCAADATIAVNQTHTYAATSTYTATLSAGGETAAQVNVYAGTPSCAVPTEDLSYGESDADVSGQVTVLQNFLIGQGLLPAGDATGFFGPLTEAAVVQFQAANGIEQTGYVGPLTLAAMTSVCSGTASPSSSQSFSASPDSGNPPLAVTFTATGLDTPASGSSYVVDFGDGNQGTMTAGSVVSCPEESPGSSGTCPAPYTVSYTYQSSGTFNATLYLEQNICGGLTLSGCESNLQVGTTTVTVGSGIGGGGGGVSSGYTTYYTFSNEQGVNFNSTNPNDPNSYTGYCLIGGSAEPCSSVSPSSTFYLFTTQQSGTIPLYAAPSSQVGNCSASSFVQDCGVTQSSTISAMCPFGFVSPYNSSYCPVPNGAPSNLLGYLYPTQYSDTVPLYSVENCSGPYFLTASPDAATQYNNSCASGDSQGVVVGYAPLPTAP